MDSNKQLTFLVSSSKILQRLDSETLPARGTFSFNIANVFSF